MHRVLTLCFVLSQLGPHKTLAGPAGQTLQKLEQEATVIPTLKRGGLCARLFLQAVAT
jgi:hypothetical protein